MKHYDFIQTGSAIFIDFTNLFNQNMKIFSQKMVKCEEYYYV